MTVKRTPQLKIGSVKLLQVGIYNNIEINHNNIYYYNFLRHISQKMGYYKSFKKNIFEVL